MGLLDDAIREHLELKRSRGADPNEVEREEREALGSSQQQAEFAPAPDETAEHELEPIPADEEEPEDAGEEHEPFDHGAFEPSAPGTDSWVEDERDEVPVEESLAHPREEG